MLTDDDLTRELNAAFRRATADLTYTGRTQPPRRVGAALSVAAVTAVAAVAFVAVTTADHPVPPVSPSAVGQTNADPTTRTAPALVTETLNFAGMTIRYQHAADAPVPIRAEVVGGGLPAGVREVTLAGTDSRVWVGTDPSSGDNALYVKPANSTDGRLFALLSATWTDKQLIDLVEHPRPVPEVSPGNDDAQN